MCFKKNKKKRSPEFLLTAFERLHNVIITSKDEMLNLADILKENRAILANFEKLSIEDANYMLTFLSGVVFALDGEVHKTGAKTFLFGSKLAYSDGTLGQFIIERHATNE